MGHFACRFFTRAFYRFCFKLLLTRRDRAELRAGASTRHARRFAIIYYKIVRQNSIVTSVTWESRRRPRVHPGCRLSRRERLFYLSRCTASSAFMACNLPDCGRLFNRGQKELPHRGGLVQAQRPHRPIGRDERARARQHRAPHECSVQTRDTPPHLVGSARHHCARR